MSWIISHAISAVKSETPQLKEAGRTLMLVALGDKSERRTRTVTASTGTQTPTMQRLAQSPTQNAKAEVTPFAPNQCAGTDLCISTT